MFGCLGRIISALLLILVGAMLHANWPRIERQLRERVPELLPKATRVRGGTIVASPSVGAARRG